MIKYVSVGLGRNWVGSGNGPQMKFMAPGGGVLVGKKRLCRASGLHGARQRFLAVR
jgi:hypothetical protein